MFSFSISRQSGIVMGLSIFGIQNPAYIFRIIQAIFLVAKLRDFDKIIELLHVVILRERGDRRISKALQGGNEILRGVYPE